MSMLPPAVPPVPAAHAAARVPVSAVASRRRGEPVVLPLDATWAGPSPEPATAAVARGYYIEPDSPPGVVVVRIFDARGRRIGRVELLDDVARHPATPALIGAWLDCVDALVRGASEAG